MYSRIRDLLMGAPANTDAASMIDFKKVKFDPTNRSHRDAIDAKIQNLNVYYNSLLKNDIIIIVPFALTALLTLGRVVGLPLGLLLCAGIAAVLYAADQFKSRLKNDEQFQNQVQDLLSIYRDSLKERGAVITQELPILNLVTSIAPFVSTEDLIHWKHNQSYPDKDFSEAFVKILAKAPHNVPSSILNDSVLKEPNAPTNALSLQAITHFLTENKWCHFLSDTVSNMNYTMYHQQSAEDNKEVPSVGLLHRVGL